ncbi:hypothetical protein NZA98_04135, partial [Escherichia coli]|nr:hypothetical protein [Escherichia coli]
GSNVTGLFPSLCSVFHSLHPMAQAGGNLCLQPEEYHSAQRNICWVNGVLTQYLVFTGTFNTR